MTTCCLCSSLVSGASNEIWNKPLFESTNFVGLPSLGSLLEGWLLLVPKRHVLSMGALPTDLVREMGSMKGQIVARLRQHYGNVCAFEHGPSKNNLRIGCGVDHAHLHIVPVNFDLARSAASFMPHDASWMDATHESCRVAFEEGKDYLYLEQPIGRGRIAVHDNFGSQIFRRAIASHLRVPDRFSWQEHPEVEIVERTVRTVNTNSAATFV